MFGEKPAPPKWQANLIATAFVAKLYPEAKRELIAAGYDRARVERMPVGQVVAIQTGRVTRYAYQEAFKWWDLPYWQAADRMVQTEEKLMREGILAPMAFAVSRGGLPIAALLLPATISARQAQARTERNRAVLQTIEAIRMYASREGRLPESLDDLSAVPAPLNPATGKNFPYEKHGNAAVLEAPAIGGRLYTAIRYEISLRKSSRK
jgi:hypothetical protein